MESELNQNKPEKQQDDDLESQRKAFYQNNPDLVGNFPVDSDQERQCPKCGNINVCTGVDHCSTCGDSLLGARRTNTHRFDSRYY